VRALIDAEAEAVHMILNGIGNDIYFTVDDCPNAKDMWIAIECLEQRESINTQDVKKKLFWEFEWSRFVTVVKQNSDLDTISYHKLFDILKQYQNEVNEIPAKRISRDENPLALVSATQHYPDYYPQVPKTYQTQTPSPRQTTSTRSHATTRSNDKAVVKASSPTPESDIEEEQA
ncbi:hypothetical protein Tco_0070124, partial [Tanacetum coccineum]